MRYSLTFNNQYSSAGKDLKSLYMTPAVQSFLNGIPAKELYREKSLYHHGTLRKVL